MFSSACTLSRCLIETLRLRRHHSRGQIMACSKHSSCDSLKQGNEICDKNLAWHYPTRTGLDSTEAWYVDIGYTDGVLDLADSIYSDSGKALDQFTQVVWKSSARLG